MTAGAGQTVPRLRFAALLWAAGSSPAAAECFRIGDVITCFGNLVGGVSTEDSVTVNIRPETSIVNVPALEQFDYCPLSPPVITVGNNSTVTNDGSLTGFGTCATAIIVGTNSTVVNNGAIDTVNAVAHGIFADSGTSVTNAGSILTRGNTSLGVYGGNDVTVRNLAGSVISTGGSGASGIFLNSNATVVNAGVIRTEASGSSPIDLPDDIFALLPTYHSVANSGLLEALGARTVAVRMASDNLTLTNSGQIKGLFRNTDRVNDFSGAVAMAGQSIAIANSGLIAGAISGIEAEALRTLSLDNTGTISANADLGRAVNVLASDLAFDNTGTITGRLAGVRLEARNSITFVNGGVIETTGGFGNEAALPVVEIATSTAMDFDVVNSGVIAARLGGLALKIGDGAQTVFNTGQILGDVDLGGGNDTVIMRADSKIDGRLIGGDGIDRLVLIDRGVLGWTSDSLEDLLQLSDGRWTVTGDFTAIRLTGILRGEMSIAEGRTLTSPSVVIDAPGLLSGLGMVRGSVINDGVIAPGPGLGTLTIDGNLAQEESGIYAVDLGTDHQSDKLNVTGQATLGGTLAVSKPSQLLLRGTERYDILMAGSGITGSFASVTGITSSFLKADLINAADERMLSLNITRLPYAGVAQNANQKSVASALDAAIAAGRTGLKPLYDQLDALDAATARQTFDQLASSLPVAVAATANAGARNVLETMTRSVSSLHGDDQPLRIWGAYGRADGGPDRGDAANGYTFDMDHIATGLDHAADGGARFGFAVAHQTGDLKFRSLANTADLAQTFVSVYAAFASERALFSGGALWGDGQARTSRLYTTPLTGGAAGLADVDALGGFASARMPISMENMMLEPSLGLQAWRFVVNGYTETGGNALVVARQQDTSLRSELGLRLAVTSGRLRPYAALEASYEMLSRHDRVHATFAADPATGFGITGLAARRTWIDAEAGLAVALDANAEARVGFSGNLTDAAQGRRAFVNFAVQW